jgi:hypothetical protein
MVITIKSYEEKLKQTRSEIPYFARNKLRNLAFFNEIATHLLGARNDLQINQSIWLSLDSGIMII